MHINTVRHVAANKTFVLRRQVQPGVVPPIFSMEKIDIERNVALVTNSEGQKHLIVGLDQHVDIIKV